MEEEKKLTGYPSIDKPWLKYYSDDIIHAPLPSCTIYEYLVENNCAYPKDIAIHYLGRRITYGELFQKIDATAASFAALGVSPGDIVTVALPSVPEALYAVYALNKIGAVANMIHPLAGEDEIIHYLNEVKSKVAILFDGTYKLIGKRIAETSLQHAIIVSAGESLLFGLKQFYYANNPQVRLPQNSVFHSWAWFMKSGKGTSVPAFPKDPDTLALISHTGGTTGEPKGVMCSDDNINALIWQVGKILPSSRQEVMLVVLPPFINYSLVNGMFEPLSLGHKIILIPDYKPEKFVTYIRRYKPNHINSIPAYLKTLLQTEEAKTISYSCFKYVYYGGEAMSEETERALNELILSRGAQYRLGKGLGCTEMVSSASLTTDECNLPGCAGIPFVRTNCMITEPRTDKELSNNEIGEICFSGPTLMIGYYNDQQATDDIIQIHSDGQRWLHTGDLGYLDENGVLFVTGRIKRIIMTKGKDGNISKIFPDRIEKVIGQHPAVAVNCVIGVPNEERIHYPVAYVALNADSRNSRKIEKELRESCRTQLPEYMRPERFQFLDELPRTSRGKIDYRALEEMAQRGE